MSRNFPDFISAYFDFAKDDFSPDKFHLWTGISALAGALERRVWVNQSARLTFPNIYVFLISGPGEGKSSAGDIAVGRLLRKVKRNGTGVSFLPDQMTDAAFVEAMAGKSSFLRKVKIADAWTVKEESQCAHYLYVSEASNSLKELAGGGEITAALTEFYDAKDYWQKRTKGGGPITLNNICCSILVGSTFNYMNVLFPPHRIMGGFASRIIYIASKDTRGRKIEWEPKARSPETEAKLLEDLQQIFGLAGQFTVQPEFAEAYVAFFEQYDQERRNLQDERLQSFLARRHTNALKIAMLCSVSESDALVLELRHWERALSFMPEIDASLALVIDSSADPGTQQGVNHIILNRVRRTGKISHSALAGEIFRIGITKDVAASTLAQLVSARLIRVDPHYVVATDPDNYLV